VFYPENQFFHVKLAPETRKYLGFSIQDEGWEELFDVFNIMLNLGINISIYEDDGKVSGHTQEKSELAMTLAIIVYRLAD
jgi:hypothetical protein